MLCNILNIFSLKPQNFCFLAITKRSLWESQINTHTRSSSFVEVDGSYRSYWTSRNVKGMVDERLKLEERTVSTDLCDNPPWDRSGHNVFWVGDERRTKFCTAREYRESGLYITVSVRHRHPPSINEATRFTDSRENRPRFGHSPTPTPVPSLSRTHSIDDYFRGRCIAKGVPHCRDVLL